MLAPFQAGSPKCVGCSDKSMAGAMTEHEQQTATLEPPPRPDKAELFNKWQIEIRQEAQEEAARKTPK